MISDLLPLSAGALRFLCINSTYVIESASLRCAKRGSWKSTGQLGPGRSGLDTNRGKNRVLAWIDLMSGLQYLMDTLAGKDGLGVAKRDCCDIHVSE